MWYSNIRSIKSQHTYGIGDIGSNATDNVRSSAKWSPNSNAHVSIKRLNGAPPYIYAIGVVE